MTDEQILKGIKIDFCIEEFVSPRVFKKYGESAWQFLDMRMLHTVYIVRELLGKSITINNWKWGGKFTQRGLRSNVGYIFKSKFLKGVMYLSGHVLGKAVDFDVKGMTAVEVREWLVRNQKQLPYKIRLECKLNGKEITWTHLDLLYNERNDKVYRFNV